ncbi:MAG: DUF4834 family protein [Prevotellaceae bacterium]|jgi:hypothetical protein|nr:DUF4834 family protein [Prevotellaceae bacterium]
MTYILFFILFIVLVGLLLIGGVLRLLVSFFRMGRKNDNHRDSSYKNTLYTEEMVPKEKIFGKDEGEYVEFEEVDEDNN